MGFSPLHYVQWLICVFMVYSYHCVVSFLKRVILYGNKVALFLYLFPLLVHIYVYGHYRVISLPLCVSSQLPSVIHKVVTLVAAVTVVFVLFIRCPCPDLPVRVIADLHSKYTHSKT